MEIKVLDDFDMCIVCVFSFCFQVLCYDNDLHYINLKKKIR